jgi:ABC-type phosphonate transport system ATPase subunit
LGGESGTEPGTESGTLEVEWETVRAEGGTAGGRIEVKEMAHDCTMRRESAQDWIEGREIAHDRVEGRETAHGHKARAQVVAPQVL